MAGTLLLTGDAKVFKSRCIRNLFIAQDRGAADNNFRRNLEKELHAATSEFHGVRCTQRCELKGMPSYTFKFGMCLDDTVPLLDRQPKASAHRRLVNVRRLECWGWYMYLLTWVFNILGHVMKVL